MCVDLWILLTGQTADEEELKSCWLPEESADAILSKSLERPSVRMLFCHAIWNRQGMLWVWRLSGQDRTWIPDLSMCGMNVKTFMSISICPTKDEHQCPSTSWSKETFHWNSPESNCLIRERTDVTFQIWIKTPLFNLLLVSMHTLLLLLLLVVIVVVVVVVLVVWT